MSVLQKGIDGGKMRYTISIKKELLDRLKAHKLKTGIPISQIISRTIETELNILDLEKE